MMSNDAVLATILQQRIHSYNEHKNTAQALRKYTMQYA